MLLSGDPHYSSLSEFTVLDAQGALLCACVGIVASGMNAPLPFANDVPDEVGHM